MIIRGKFCFTLIEALIALVWTSILLSTLTFFYFQMSELNRKTEILQKSSFKWRYIENRLSQIFPKAAAANTIYKDFFFFTVLDPGGELTLQGSPISLIFTYDNGADKKKELSNHVVGRLFLGSNKNLILATWPSPKRWEEGATPPMKLEVLMDDVDALKMEFFVPPDKGWTPKFLGDQAGVVPAAASSKQTAPATNAQQKPVNPLPTTPSKNQKVIIKPDLEGSWKEEWSQDYKLLPGLVRLTIKQQGKVRSFTFPLSQSGRQIIYTQ